MSAVPAPPRRPSWVAGAAGGPYDADNLPYAVFARAGDQPRVGARIGDHVVDLAPLAASELVEHGELFGAATLAPLMASGRDIWGALRGWLVELLTEDAGRRAVEPWLVPLREARLSLPFDVADYVDFYSSLHHATRVGEIFRPGSDPLPRAWRLQPVGYHGRAGTLVVSGTPVSRPRGLRAAGGAGPVGYGPTEQLDLEAELAFAVGVPTAPGESVATHAFADHVFGVMLLNDWSARDVQRLESVPLGPFLGKSFATSVSAWVTPLDALSAARADLPGQEPAPAPHLAVDAPAGYDIDIEVGCNANTLARVPYSSTYWGPAQMLAHLTSGGSRLRTGDVFASGTVSASEPERRGCLLELTWGGRDPVRLGDGSVRTWLLDGDEVVLTATAPGALGGRIALGEVRGRVEPAP